MSSRSKRSSAAILLVSMILAACSDTTDPTRPPARTVETVSVSPPSGSLLVGDDLVFSATARDAAGGVIEGRGVTWSSADPLVATVSGGGLVTGVAEGRTTIRAAIDGKVGTAEAIVSLAPVSTVEVDPATLTLIEGESRRVDVVARDARGRVLSGRSFSWSSRDESIVTVDANGMLVARAKGNTVVTVTVEGRSAAIAVTVQRVPVASVGVSPTSLVLEVGEIRQLTAIVMDAAGNILNGRTVTWTSDANATVTSEGLVTALNAGYASIIAESEGKTYTVPATIVTEEPSNYDLLYHRQSSASVVELFTLALGTGNSPVRLNAGTVSSQATASPDGQRIAFYVSQIDIGTNRQIDDIFAVNRNGMFVKQLTTHSDVEDQPAWSPDGTKIAYRRWTVSGRMDIWSMNPDGSGQLNLTADLAAGSHASAPAWSHDGSRIAFATMENGAGGTTASIWIMDANGGNKRRLTTTLTGFDATPTWSPDGQRVAFIRYFGHESDIVFVGTAGGAEVRLSLAGRQSTPAWSPEGNRIAFAQDDPQGYPNVYTVGPDGRGLKLRTTNPAWRGGYRPSWIRSR